jgi:hypothetical protein
MSRRRRENSEKRPELASSAQGWQLPEEVSLPPRPTGWDKALLAAALALQALWIAFLAAMVVCK